MACNSRFERTCYRKEMSPKFFLALGGKSFAFPRFFGHNL